MSDNVVNNSTGGGNGRTREGKNPAIRGRMAWAIGCLLLAWLAVDVWILTTAEAPWVTAVELAQNEADGERPHWTTQAAPGIWWAAAITATLALGLLATMRWWAVGSVTKEGDATGSGRAAGGAAIPRWSGGKWFWVGLLLLVIVGSALRLPLATKSLWWDELWAVKQASHGTWREDPGNPGELRFYESTWDRAAWYYLKPTNHPTASLTQMLSLKVWRALTGAERTEFSDLAIRVPSLLASALAIFGVGLLLRSWGMPVTGLVAAAWMAVHPWAIRYGVDARAYALVLPLVPLALLWLTGLHRQPWRWRWWWLLAATQFFLLWTFPNAIPMALALFGTAALVLWHRARGEADLPWKTWARLVAVHVVAAMAFLHAFLPNVVQVFRWQQGQQQLLSGKILMDSLTGLGAGVEFTESSAGSPVVDWQALEQGLGHGDVWWMIHVAMMLLGLLALWHRNRPGAIAIAAIVLAATAYVALSWWRDIYFYSRYLIYLLPLGIALAAMGWTQGAAWLARRVRASERLVASAAGGFALGWFLLLVWPQLTILWQRPISPMHDTVRYIREQSDNPVVIAYGLGGHTLDVYAPGAVRAGDRETILEGLERARDQDREAWLVRGYDAFDRRHIAGGFELIDDPQWFEFRKQFDGIEPLFQYRVYQAVER